MFMSRVPIEKHNFISHRPLLIVTIAEDVPEHKTTAFESSGGQHIPTSMLVRRLSNMRHSSDPGLLWDILLPLPNSLYDVAYHVSLII